MSSTKEALELIFDGANFSATTGVLFGLICIKAKRVLKSDTSWLKTKVKVLVFLASVDAVVGYMAFVVACDSKESCNATHAYISFFPVTSFSVKQKCASKVRKLKSLFP